LRFRGVVEDVADVVCGLEVGSALGVLLEEGFVEGLEVGIGCWGGEGLFDDLRDRCGKRFGEFGDWNELVIQRGLRLVVTDLFDGSARFVRARWGLPDQPVVPLRGTSAPANTSLEEYVSTKLQEPR
jgi:hypothetical protein